MRNISQHMLSPSSDSMRGNVHRLTEAARGTEASPLPSRVISHPSSTSSPSLNVNPDARVLQDRTSWQSRPYTFPPSPHSLFSLSGTTSMDHSYRRYQCECGSKSSAHHNSPGPNDAGPPSQASEAILSITPFDRASSAETSGLSSTTQVPSLEPLKCILSSKSGRKSLYALPTDQATRIIEYLEQGLREDSGLCAYHQERFFVVLRKMCREHRSLPSSYAITGELKKIGEPPTRHGGYANVWYGVYQGSNVAVKVLHVPPTDLASIERNFCREVVLWKQFRHPNVLPLTGASRSSNTFTMVSEWMEHGTIMDFITACPRTNRLKLLADVARGLKYLHDWPSVHADLKSSNILIDSDFCARVADFGLTSALYNHPMSISVTAPTRGGTLRWMAPELFNDDAHPSKASDIYAFGMVAYEVFAHKYPFSRIASLLVPGLVFAGQRPSRPVNREILGLSDDVWMLVEKCWDGDSTVRPNIADVLPFFEAASHHWASSTSKAIANLDFDHLITVQESSTTETTFTASSVTGYRSVFPNPCKAWRSLPMPNKMQSLPSVSHR